MKIGKYTFTLRDSVLRKHDYEIQSVASAIGVKMGENGIDLDKMHMNELKANNLVVLHMVEEAKTEDGPMTWGESAVENLPLDVFNKLLEECKEHYKKKGGSLD